MSLSFGSSEEILSFQNYLQQIDSHTHKNGTLYLNCSQNQKFRRTQNVSITPVNSTYNTHTPTSYILGSSAKNGHTEYFKHVTPPPEFHNPIS